MADPRIISIELDEHGVGWRSMAVEQERRIAIADLIGANHFRLYRQQGDGYAGPYSVRLGCIERRLVIHIARADGQALETLVLSLSGLRRTVRDYMALCDSYHRAVQGATPQQVETVDMARRGLHNAAAELLQQRLQGKIEIDFDTARRLFTLICALQFRG